MTVKFITSVASADFSYRPQEVAIIADTLAAAWVASGICEIVAPVKPKQSKKE